MSESVLCGLGQARRGGGARESELENPESVTLVDFAPAPPSHHGRRVGGRTCLLIYRLTVYI
jgi:hypothetical protein